MILSDWHIDPEIIFDSWTEEKLLVLLDKRNKRIRRASAKVEPKQQVRKMSDKELFASMGVTPRVVKIQ